MNIMNCFKYLLFQFLLLFTVSTLSAQGNEMLIEQIQGKTITRENFSESGKLSSRQEFLVGKLQQSDKNYSISLQAKLYDEAGKLESTYSITYKCKPGESNVLLSVFTIKPRKQEISASVESGDFKNLYGLSPGEFSNTISLRMNIETGMLNFLGSKNNVTIKDRSKAENSNQITISSVMTIKAYLLGIKIKTIKYNVTEYLTTQGVLQKQIFKENDGSYFTMDYK